MAKVKLEVLLALAETLGMPETSEEKIGESGDGATPVRDMLVRLATRYPRFSQTVFDADTRRMTGRVAVFFNGRPLELTDDGLQTGLKDGDTLTFVPLIEGG
ncbi:MAG: MoaD/ThiS family protein [Dehalococcoidales bacterium]|nr:MoaD/ThiS family protein [Dehalococcoidales bacterium]